MGQRLDRLKPGHYLLKWTLFVRFALFWDFFDLSMAGVLLGFWLQSGASTTSWNATFISAAALGMLVGNILTAAAVDRVGRKAVLQCALLLVAVTSLLSATLPFSMSVLIVLRFLCGIGMGSMPVPATLLLVEITPAAARASWTFWSSLVGQAGLFASAVAGYLLIPSEGWRWMFAIPGIGCLILLVIGRTMPESPRWLASKGRSNEADIIVQKFEKDQDLAPLASCPRSTEPKTSPTEPDAPRSEYFKRLIVGCVILIAANASTYLFMQWLPTILIASKINLADSLIYNLVIVSGTLFAGVAGGLIADRVGRRKMMILTALVGACCAASFTWLIGWSASLGMMAGFVLLAILIYLGTVGFLYTSEIFPTRIRGAYLGIATSAFRVCNVVLPLAVLALMPVGIGKAVTGMIAALLLAVVIAVWTMRVETAGIPLDTKAPT